MIPIKFITDFTCPYCYVNRKALLEAMKGWDVDIEWLPYEASPTDRPQVDVYHDPVKKQQYRKYLAKPAKQLKLEAKFPPKVIPRPYTRLATEARYHADVLGKGDEFTQRVLDAYFVEEQNIGRADLLVKLAGEVGLDEADFAHTLEDGVYTEFVQMLEEEVKAEFQPKTLPTILIGDTIRLDGGVYDTARFRDLLHQAAEHQNVALAGQGCSEQGCTFYAYL